jgi:hypothetical protein
MIQLGSVYHKSAFPDKMIEKSEKNVAELKELKEKFEAKK